MKSTRKWKNASFSTILWAILMVVICVVPCSAVVTVDDGETLNLDYAITNDSLNVLGGGTANLLSGAHVDLGILAFGGSVLNIHSGTIGEGYSIIVFSGSPAASVTVYGLNFAEEDFPNPSVPLEYGAWTPSDGSGTLKGNYENSDPINLVFISDVPILLAPPGGSPPENEPPVADAGPDLTVFTKDITSTIIEGTATDPDEGDTLTYRWVEGIVEFTLWEDVGSNGEAPLDLGTILPQYLGIGIHTLTLEVTDGIETASDDMVLTIEIAPLTIDIKPGSYPNSINLGSNGVVPVAILSSSDFDATAIPADTVFLAGSGVAVRGKGNKLMAHEEDVNEDGFIDLVVQVETENLDPGTIQDGMACLKVHESSDPESLVLYEGCDEITIVPPE